MNNIDAIKAITMVASRVSLYICLAIITCTWISNCELTENMVVTCEESCKGYGSHMESVTSRECRCTTDSLSAGVRSDKWVIPKK